MSRAVWITVNVVDPPANSPPIVSILSPHDGDSLYPGVESTLDGSVTEPDGDPVSYRWTVAVDGYGRTVATTLDATWRPGDYITDHRCRDKDVTLQLTATDKDGSSIATVNLSVIYPPCCSSRRHKEDAMTRGSFVRFAMLCTLAAAVAMPAHALPPGPAPVNADKVDGFDASATPKANTLLALDGSAHYPLSVLTDCAFGQILKFTSFGWACGTDAGGGPYFAGAGLTLAGTTFSASFTPSGGDAGSATTVARGDHVHDARYPTKTSLSAAGTINTDSNPVDWTQLKNVPPGFADGVDNATSGPATDVVCVGCVGTDDIALDAVTASEIADGAVGTADLADGAVTERKLSFDPATQAELDARSPRLVFGPTSIAVGDALGNVGTYPSITLGADGLPVASYYDETGRHLDVLHCGNPSCTDSSRTVVDGAPLVGQYSSIAIGADRLPIVSYYDAGNEQLKVLHCGNAACTAGNTISVVDGPGVGSYTSIAIASDGLPIIGYHDVAGGGLKLAHCSNRLCVTFFTIRTLDEQSGAGTDTSIASGADGLPVVSYIGSGNKLFVAHCGDTTCDPAGLSVSVVSTGTPLEAHVDGGTSLVIGEDGRPVIAYQTTVSSFVPGTGIARCRDELCAGPATNAEFELLLRPSVTIGADGLPVFGAYEAFSNNLIAKHCATPDCVDTTRWVADSALGDTGYSAITTGADGQPVLAYYDAARGDLKVARCTDPFCVPHFRRR